MLFIGLALSSVACSEANEDASGAEALWGQVKNDYRSWSNPTPYGSKQPSHTLHEEEVQIFFNSTVSDLHQDLDDCRVLRPTAMQGQIFFATALDAAGNAITEWPIGSVIAKDGYRGGELAINSVLEMGAEGWFFAEYDSGGGVLFSGTPEICTSCHAGAMDDGLFSAHLNYRCPPVDDEIYKQ